MAAIVDADDTTSIRVYEFFSSFLLNGISFVVRGGGGGGGGRRRFLCTYSSTVVCTDLLYMCRCAVNKNTKSPPLRAETLLLSCTLRAWRSVPLWTATITSMATRACAPD